VEENKLQEDEKKVENLLPFNLMKSKIVCLSRNNEFKEILKGEKQSNRYFTIFFKKLSNKKENKLNISFIAKKKLGNAVNRNKIKRKLRNITNEAVKKLSLKLNYSYLIIAKETILKNEYSDIKKTMFAEFNKIK
tara:strand:+ start:3782 stop:4186 length:405 start_codon:yes stop_codon:yes gene_type:complete